MTGSGPLLLRHWISGAGRRVGVMERGSVLAADLGASGLRAALVDAAGGVRHAAAVPHVMAAEADAGAWWGALCQAADAVARAAGPEWADVRALCITGVTRTQVLLDAGAHPLRPALTFRDTRAASVAEAAGLDAFHPAARLLWLARHEPEVLAATVAVVDPKDALSARLTGRLATDRICGSRLSAAAPVLAGLALPATENLEPGTMLGPVRPDAPGALGALAGVPVVLAAHDTWCAVLGLGALRDGAAYSLSGSTDVLGVLSARAGTAPGLLTDEWAPGLWHLGGPSNAGGDSLAWLLGLLAPGEAVGPALDRLLRTERQAQPVLFLPYLDGERTPYWDPSLRAGFAGLHRRHGPADLVWAVLEGVACLNRIVLDRAEAASGTVRELRFGGGGAASPAWRQVKADVLQRPVLATTEPETGLLGAGIAAWTALGAYPGLGAAQDAMVRTASRHIPARDTTSLFALFRQAEAGLAGVGRGLAQCAA